MFNHEEEVGTVGVLLEHCLDNPRSALEVHFSTGEVYECTFSSAYDSDNSADLEIEPDNPAYDEFHQVSLEIKTVIHDGIHHLGRYMTIDYRDFPVLITDTSTCDVVYSADANSSRKKEVVAAGQV